MLFDACFAGPNGTPLETWLIINFAYFILWQTNMAMATRTVWRGKSFINNSCFSMFECGKMMWHGFCMPISLFSMHFIWSHYPHCHTKQEQILKIYTHANTANTSESICNTYRKMWAIQGTWFSSLLCRDYKCHQCHWRNHHIDPT